MASYYKFFRLLFKTVFGLFGFGGIAFLLSIMTGADFGNLFVTVTITYLLYKRIEDEEKNAD